MNKLVKLFIISALAFNISAKQPQHNKLKNSDMPSNMSDEVFQDLEKSKKSNGLASELRNFTLKLKHKPKKNEIEQVKELGAEIVGTYDKYIMIKIESKDLEYIKELPFLDFIDYPSEYINNNTQTQSDILNSLTKLKYTGKGIKIAVIDAGFKLINESIKKQVKNHWKSFSEKRSADGGPSLEGYSWSHGTATLEIINKIAPDAELYPITINDKASFSILTAIDSAIDYKPDIICLVINDIRARDFLDGTGDYGKIIDKYSKEKKIVFVTPAGNNLKRHYRGVFDPDSQGLHNYNNSPFSFSLNKEQDIQISVTWKCNSFNNPTKVFDVYVKNKDGDIISKRESPNTPICSRVFSFNPNQDKSYSQLDNKYTIDIRGRDLVKKSIITSESKVPFHIFLYGDAITKVDNFTPQYSLDPNLSVAKSAITVGASYNNKSDKVTDFSSWGSGENNLMKPDFIVPSGFKTLSIPFFTGTSSSVPYMTALISLIIQKDSKLKNNPKLLISKLKNHSSSKNNWNRVKGYGLIDIEKIIR